ncbi:hypothetical protein D918_09728 [Trichuris suis]|nr:hypothetical protein D918_09728 [Trichuris suis]
MGSPFAGFEMAHLFSTVRPQISKGVLDHLMGFVGEKLQPPFPLCVDIGCGTCQSTSLFAPYFNSVVGIDISEDMITLANNLNKEKNVSFRLYDKNLIFPIMETFKVSMHNELHAQGCWNATRYLVDTEFADVSMPYRTCKRLSSREHEELCMRKTMLIEDFIALLKSWSALKVYENRKGGRNDFLSAIGDQLTAQIPNSNTRTPIEVIFPWFIVMSRKEH